MQGDSNEYIDIYDSNISYYIRCEHLARYIYASEQIRKRKAKCVLDVACGSGYGSCELSKYAEKVLAVDKNPPFPHYAKPNIIFCHADLNENNWADSLSSYGNPDAAVCFETLEHINNPETFLMAISKIIKRKGLLFVSVPDGDFEKVDENENILNPFHLHRFSMDAIKSIIEKCGFTIKRTLYQPVSAAIYRNEARALRDLKADEKLAKEMWPSYKSMHYYARLYAWPDENKGQSYSIMLMCEKN